MSVTYWTLRCPGCGMQLVAERPDTEFICGRCGATAPGVSAPRARMLERVTTSTDEFLRHKGVYPEHNGFGAILSRAVDRVFRRTNDHRSSDFDRDEPQPAAPAAESVAVPHASIIIP